MSDLKRSKGWQRPGPGRNKKPDKGVLLKSYPPPNLRQRVRDIAKAKGISESQVVIQALEYFFKAP